MKVIQYDYHGEDNQLWNISYNRRTGEAIIFSYKYPHCALDVRSTGLYLDLYEEDKVSQLWIYKDDRFFNQGRVMTAFLPIRSTTLMNTTNVYIPSIPMDTFPLSLFGSDDQKFSIKQKNNIKNPISNQDETIYLTR